MKLLCLCDSPTLQTGFGRVIQNLIKHWSARPVAPPQIDVWGIGYDGNPHTQPCRIWRAWKDWSEPGGLDAFLALLATGGYTHVFIMQDTFMLSRHNFPRALRSVCEQHNIYSVGYFPVDAPLEKEWLGIVEAVDYAVAYTSYGYNQMARYTPRAIGVIPHGVDSQVYKPLGRKTELREKLFNGWLKEGDYLMLNVSANQRRKDVSRSLEILAGLMQRGIPAKLLLNMDGESADGVSLEAVARQLGLTKGKEWDHNGRYFRRGHAGISEPALNQIYNAADLLLSTTLGEGWGLPIFEALAAGCPVAIPDHTACHEHIVMLEFHDRILALPTEPHGVVMPADMSRVRYRVDVDQAVTRIMENRRSLVCGEGLSMHSAEWFSWRRISEDFGVIFADQPRSIYLEYGGGLGDVFNGMYQGHSYAALDAMQPGESATVALICHNPFAREIFDAHPKRSQIKVLELGYWSPEEDKAKRQAAHLPAAGTRRCPATDQPIVFYPHENDLPVLKELEKVKYIMVAASAGLPDRNIPAYILAQIRQWAEEMRLAEPVFAFTGRTYERHDRREIEAFPQAIDMIDGLSVPGTAVALANASGIITCHSALNILGWHMKKPTLLLYPESVRRNHIAKKDQWAFGIDYPHTVHCTFEEFTDEHFRRFIECVWHHAAHPEAVI